MRGYERREVDFDSREFEDGLRDARLGFNGHKYQRSMQRWVNYVAGYDCGLEHLLADRLAEP